MDKKYWNDQWLALQTPWDIGYASPPIVEYMQQVEDKNLKILIPGCGQAYEIDQLIALGFNNITVIDIAPKLVSILQEKYQSTPQVSVVLGDFFEHQNQYDIILEQTFFCALNPVLRNRYAQKMFDLLNVNGKLVGVLFNREFQKEGPPFGGFESDYKKIFDDYFSLKTWEKCNNSISPRKDSEWFMILIKKP